MGEKLQLAKELLAEFYQTAKRCEEQCRELENKLQARDRELEALKKLQAKSERENIDISQRLKDKDAELEKQKKLIDTYLRTIANDCGNILKATKSMKAMENKAANQDQKLSELFDQLRQLLEGGRERADAPVPPEAMPEKSSETPEEPSEMQMNYEIWRQMNSAQ